MARPSFDRDKAIRVLIDAMHLGDDGAAKLHGIHPASVVRYRRRLRDAPELLEAARAEKEANSTDWREQLAAVKLKVLGKLSGAVESCTDVYKLSGALKILADADLGERSLDLALGGTDGGLGGSGAGSDREGEAPSQAPRRALSILSGGKPS